MSRNKGNVPAVTVAASLAAKAISRMETEARAVHAASNVRNFQCVSDGGAFSALIKHGKKTIQIEGDSFAISIAE